MAEIREGVHRLCLGNYWDFHAGCSGTQVRFKDGTIIDFKDEWPRNLSMPTFIAKMIADRIGATLVMKQRKTPIEC